MRMNGSERLWVRLRPTGLWLDAAALVQRVGALRLQGKGQFVAASGGLTIRYHASPSVTMALLYSTNKNSSGLRGLLFLLWCAQHGRILKGESPKTTRQREGHS